MWHSLLFVLEGFALGTATTFLTMAAISSRRTRQRLRAAFTKKMLELPEPDESVLFVVTDFSRSSMRECHAHHQTNRLLSLLQMP
jgi:hypothetical protein